MNVRRFLNRFLTPVTGYEMGKVEFGQKLWPDVQELIGREASVVFDIGANEGQSAGYFLDFFPKARIYSFEPASGTYVKLAELARENPRIVAVNKGVGATPGKAVLLESKMHATNSFLPRASRSGDYIGPEAQESTRKTEVEITTLDLHCRQESISEIDLLKVDVQGFELSVLKGSQEMLGQRKIGCLVLEICFVPLYENQATFQDLTALLNRHGYGLAGFYEIVRNPEREMMWCEVVYFPHRK